jgi:hypothetical protein
MKTLTFHLPEYCGKIKIIGKPTRAYGDTEKSAKELSNVLVQLPGEMYPILVEEVVIEFLRRTLSLQTLQKIKDTGNQKNLRYLKDMDFYRFVQRVLEEKEQGASRDVSGNE